MRRVCELNRIVAWVARDAGLPARIQETVFKAGGITLDHPFALIGKGAGAIAVDISFDQFDVSAGPVVVCSLEEYLKRRQKQVAQVEAFLRSVALAEKGAVGQNSVKSSAQVIGAVPLMQKDARKMKEKVSR